VDQAQIDLLLTYGIPLVVALAGVGYKWVMSKMSPTEQYKVQDAIDQVVRGVEQMYAAAPGTGPAKKAEAIKLAQSVLADLGLNVSDETLGVLIESAVHALNNATPTPASAPEAADQPLPVGA
jgi:hypothetical protein